MRVNAPQEIMRQLFLGRGSEAYCTHAQWIHLAKYVPDGAILAGRVHALQHDQDTTLRFRVQKLLQLVDTASELRQALFVLVLAATRGTLVVRIPVLEIDLRSRLHAIFGETHGRHSRPFRPEGCRRPPISATVKPMAKRNLARSSFGALLMLTAVALLALSSGAVDPAALSAGTSTVSAESESAYQQPAPVLSAAQLELFQEGSRGFAQRWVVAPSILGLWGRGPTSNGEACIDCHENGGRGRPPADATEPMRSMLVRLSVVGVDPHGAPNPHPAYGDQLQNQGILGRVPPEGDPRLIWEVRSIAMADGELVQLRAPILDLRHVNFGPLGSDVMTSARVAPPLVGVGLLDAVSDEAIQSIAADQQRKGLRGRPNVVWDLINGRDALGRFG